MMLCQHENEKGFTLIELMIVVAIIGILAAMALASFRTHQCRVKQAEAKTHLGTIRTSEEAYFAEYDTYSSSFSKIGFSSKGDTRYDYSIQTDSGGFTATAAGKADQGMAGDAWTIDEVGDLSLVSSACT